MREFVLSGHIVGAVVLLLGLVSLISYAVYFANRQPPTTFVKLKPMQERWGEVPGAILHFFSYVVAPIACCSMLMVW